MRALSMSFAVSVGVTLCLLAGCALNKTRDLVVRGSAPGDRSWGRTILVCEVDHPAWSDAERERARHIVDLAGKALDAVPGAIRLPPGSLVSNLPGRSPMSLSDSEISAAALAAGADTVVLMRVLGYGGELTLSLLPPYWSTGTHYDYHVRAIDVRTGALYLDAHRGRFRTGPFTAHTRSELDRDLEEDMRGLFSVKGEGDEPTPRERLLK